MDRLNCVAEYFALLNKPNLPSPSEVRDAVKVRNKILPSRLYRYRGCTAHALENFEKSLLWLSAPGDFNDPFDCSLSVLKATFIEKAFASSIATFLSSTPWDSFLSTSEKEAIKASPNPFRELGSILFVQTGEPRVTEEQFDRILESTLKTPLDKLAGHLNDLVKGKLRICCFSEVPDSILMWSHYANNHQGFCLEYDTGLMTHSDFLGNLHPVNYRSELFDASQYLPFDRFPGSNEWMATLAACHKSPEWSYEKEWRYVFPDGRTTFPLKASALLLGAKITSENEEVLKKLGRDLGLTVSKASLATDSFKLIMNAI